MESKEEYNVNLEMDYENLTNWKNEPRVKDLKGDLQEAIPHHQAHVTEVQGWLDYLNITGIAKPKKVAGRSNVSPKLIRKQAEWRYAALSEPFLSSDTLFKTSPYTFEDKDRAEQAGMVLNHQWNNDINKVSFIDEYVRTGVDEGTIVVRVGWNFEEREVRVPNYVEYEVERKEEAEMLAQAAAQAAQDPAQLNEIPEDFKLSIEATMREGIPIRVMQKGWKKEKQTVRNHPTAEVVEHKSVIIDPSCKGDIKKAQFVIYQFETSRADLEKEEDKYFNLDKINVERNAITNIGALHNEDDAQGFNFQDEPRKKFIAYEYWGYWDIDNSGLTKPIVATWVGDTMIRLEESPYPDEGLPFVVVHYLPRRKHVYGEPDGELLQENQQIAGAVTRGMLDIMGRSAVGQMGVRKGALDVTNQRRFDAGQDYTYNNTVDPAMAFFTHKYPELPSSAPFMLEMQNQEAEALTGVKAFHGGISGEGLGRSATAARSAMDAASKREMGILRRMAKGIVEIGRKHMAMNAVFLDEESVIKITNDKFINVKRDDLASRADIVLDISTAEAENAKAEELSFMLQTMGNNMPMETTMMIMADIAKLRKMPELAQKLENFEPPPPDPLDQALKEAELLKIRAEIKKLEAESIENLAEAELDQQRARKEASTADKLDLDFVEQESGVTAARDQQKIQAQAESQGRLKVLEKELENRQSATTTNSDDTPTF